jgi:hypothetical protein
MLVKISYKKKLLAIIIKANFKKKGVEFFTPNNFSQQLGYMNYKKNHKIDAHIHKNNIRKVIKTQEVLLIKSGKIRIDFYYKKNSYLRSYILEKGDVILLSSGGHGFKFLKNSEIIEIKQGPFHSEVDKVRFDHVDDKKVKY